MNFQNNIHPDYRRIMLEYYYNRTKNDLNAAKDTLSDSAIGSVIAASSSGFIDDLIDQRKSILAAKLDVLTAELHERLSIRKDNIASFIYDECKLGSMISQLYFTTGGYIDKSPRRMASLEKQGFDIQKERRDQDVECWRDIVMLTKDFLSVWEAYEQAKSRAYLMKDE